MPCAATAAESSHARSAADREARGARLEAKAVQEIVDDLEIGWRYPRRTHPSICIGDFLAEVLDEDQLPRALTALAYGSETERADMRLALERLCADGALAQWVKTKHPELVERKVEQLLDDEENDR